MATIRQEVRDATVRLLDGAARRRDARPGHSVTAGVSARLGRVEGAGAPAERFGMLARVNSSHVRIAAGVLILGICVVALPLYQCHASAAGRWAAERRAHLGRQAAMASDLAAIWYEAGDTPEERAAAAEAGDRVLAEIWDDRQHYLRTGAEFGTLTAGEALELAILLHPPPPPG